MYVMRANKEIGCILAGNMTEFSMEVRVMGKQSAMSPEQSFFAVFCIEALADELGTTGDKVYKMLTDKSDILDEYIVPCYGSLHTLGKEYIVSDIIDLMKKRGVLQ